MPLLVTLDPAWPVDQYFLRSNLPHVGEHPGWGLAPATPAMALSAACGALGNELRGTRLATDQPSWQWLLEYASSLPTQSMTRTVIEAVAARLSTDQDPDHHAALSVLLALEA